jgi:hypothetical protein
MSTSLLCFRIVSVELVGSTSRELVGSTSRGGWGEDSISSGTRLNSWGTAVESAIVIRSEVLFTYLLTVAQKSNATNYTSIIISVLHVQKAISHLLFTPYVSFTNHRRVKTRSYWIKHDKWTIKKRSPKIFTIIFFKPNFIEK